MWKQVSSTGKAIEEETSPKNIYYQVCSPIECHQMTKKGFCASLIGLSPVLAYRHDSLHSCCKCGSKIPTELHYVGKGWVGMTRVEPCRCPLPSFMLVCEHIWIRKKEEHLVVPIVWLLCFKIAKLRWTTNRGRHIRRRGKNQWVLSVVEAE